MPLIEQPLSPEDAADAAAAEDYWEARQGRGAEFADSADALFTDADTRGPLPEWLREAQK